MADIMHQNFLKDLWRSYPAVWVMAWWYWREFKCHVLLPPPQAAPDRSQRDKYSDEGDFYVILPEEKESVRMEVKELRWAFSGRETYKFPTFIICSVRKYERSRVKPSFFIIVSHDRRAYALLNVKKSRSTWWTELCRDDRQKYAGEPDQEKYVCSLDQVEFLPLRQPQNYEDEEMRRFVEEAIGHKMYDEKTEKPWKPGPKKEPEQEEIPW